MEKNTNKKRTKNFSISSRSIEFDEARALFIENKENIQPNQGDATPVI